MIFVECTICAAPRKSRVLVRVDLHRKAVECGIAEACPSAEETSDQRFVGKNARERAADDGLHMTTGDSGANELTIVALCGHLTAIVGAFRLPMRRSD